MHWVLELMNYEYEIEHKPGIHNGAADAISRIPKYPKSTENQTEIPGDPHIMFRHKIVSIIFHPMNANCQNLIGYKCQFFMMMMTMWT